jgi:hypothetical protein
MDSRALANKILMAIIHIDDYEYLVPNNNISYFTSKIFNKYLKITD